MCRSCLTSDFSKAVSAFSEKVLIRKICGWFAPQIVKPPYGPGDDCAVIDSGVFKGRIVSTSDAVILGRHFEESANGRLVGKKAVNRNVSDIASMGGMPLYAMTSAIMGPNVSIEWLEDFCHGMRDAAQKWNIKFIGGDLAKGEENFFSMHVNLLGDAQNPLLRTGAKIGHSIYVTGPLGASYESGRHLDFEPRVNEGLFLSGTKAAGACTDISDGLASDLENIIPCGACAELFADNIPLAPFPGNTIEKALSDGEDYELLFTAYAESGIAGLFKERFGYAPFEVGKIKTAHDADGSGAVYLNQNGNCSILKLSGFSHF